MKRGILLVLALLYLTTAQNPLDGSEGLDAASRAYFPLVNVNANVSVNYETDFNATLINELPSLTTAQLQDRLQKANATLQVVRTRANQTLNNSVANATAGVNGVQGQLSQFLSETSLRVQNIADPQIHMEHSLRVLFALNQQEKLEQNIQLNAIPNNVVAVHVQNVANVQIALARSQALDQLEAACRAALLNLDCTRATLAALTVSPFPGTNATQTAIFNNYTTANAAYNASVTGLLVSVTDVLNQLASINSSLNGTSNSTLSAVYTMLVMNLNNAKNFQFADYDTVFANNPLVSNASANNAVFLELIRYQMSDLVTFGELTSSCSQNTSAVRSFTCQVTSNSVTRISNNDTAISERAVNAMLSTFVGYTAAARATAAFSFSGLVPVMTVTVVELDVTIVRTAYEQAVNSSTLQDANNQAQAQYQNLTNSLTQGATFTQAKASDADARARALSASLNDTTQTQLNQIQANADEIQQSSSNTVADIRTFNDNNQYANMSQLAIQAYFNRQAVLLAQWDVSSNILQQAVTEAELRVHLAVRDLFTARNQYDVNNNQQARDRYNSVVVGYSASLNASLNLNASRVLAYQEYQQVVDQNTAVWLATIDYLNNHNEQLQQNATLAIATVRNEFQSAENNITLALQEIIIGLRYPSVQNVSVSWDFTVTSRISVNVVIFDTNATENTVNDHIAIIRSALVLLSQSNDVSVSAASAKRQSSSGNSYNGVVGDSSTTPTPTPLGPPTPVAPSTPTTPTPNTPSNTPSPITPVFVTPTPVPTPTNSAAGVLTSLVMLIICLVLAL